jgi:hypothetical protein
MLDAIFVKRKVPPPQNCPVYPRLRNRPSHTGMFAGRNPLPRMAACHAVSPGREDDNRNRGLDQTATAVMAKPLRPESN